MITSYVFDIYGTLINEKDFDNYIEKIYPGKGKMLSDYFFTKKNEYIFVRQLMNRYESDDVITREALRYASEVVNVDLTSETENHLLNAFSNLPTYEGASFLLSELKKKHFHTYALSNGTLHPLFENNGLSSLFDRSFNAEMSKQYKPTAGAYQFVMDQTGLKPEQIMFVSAHGWDIAGAKSMGFSTTWVNRNGQPAEKLNLFDYEVPDLKSVLTTLRR